jgi:hypothetical protein
MRITERQTSSPFGCRVERRQTWSSNMQEHLLYFIPLLLGCSRTQRICGSFSRSCSSWTHMGCSLVPCIESSKPSICHQSERAKPSNAERCENQKQAVDRPAYKKQVQKARRQRCSHTEASRNLSLSSVRSLSLATQRISQHQRL